MAFFSEFPSNHSIYGIYRSGERMEMIPLSPRMLCLLAAAAASLGNMSGRDKKNSAPGNKSVQINLNRIFFEGHFIRYPKGISFKAMRRHIRSVFGLSGLYEHRMTHRSPSADLAKNQIELISLFCHVSLCLFGNLYFFHLYPSSKTSSLKRFVYYTTHTAQGISRRLLRGKIP